MDLCSNAARYDQSVHRESISQHAAAHLFVLQDHAHRQASDATRYTLSDAPELIQQLETRTLRFRIGMIGE